MPLTPQSVIIAEDQAALRLSMSDELSKSGYNVVAEPSDGHAAVALAKRLRPSVIIVRKDLPGLDGIRCAQQIRQSIGSEIGIIVTLARPSDFWDAIESGANGYILRALNIELLPFAVKQVDAGVGWIGPDIAHYLVAGRGFPLLRSSSKKFFSSPTLNVLSDREQDVVELMVDGASNQHIADALGLKLDTVKVHVKSILKKMQADSRAHLISIILQSGIKGT